MSGGNTQLVQFLRRPWEINLVALPSPATIYLASKTRFLCPEGGHPMCPMSLPSATKIIKPLGHTSGYAPDMYASTWEVWVQHSTVTTNSNPHATWVHTLVMCNHL